MPGGLARTEVDDIEDRLPGPELVEVLDICCGPGRHAAALSERGYDVTGIDRDRVTVEQAAERIPSGRFIELDQRDLIGVVPLLAIANMRRPCRRRQDAGRLLVKSCSRGPSALRHLVAKAHV